MDPALCPIAELCLPSLWLWAVGYGWWTGPPQTVWNRIAGSQCQICLPPVWYSSWTLHQALQMHPSFATAQRGLLSHSVLLLPSPPLLLPSSAHTWSCSAGHNAKASITVAEVAGASHGHRNFCWVGAEGSLVRLLQASPGSFPTSTFGFFPCPHFPVKSRITPLSSLD